MKVVAACFAAMLTICGSANADTILFEDFEDAAITYSTSVADDLTDIANRDYFGRIASDTASTPADVVYSNMQGTGFFGVQDSDGANSGDVDTIELLWTGVNTASYTNLQLSWMLAEDLAGDGEHDWDASSSLRIEVNDGSGWVQIFGVEAEDNGDGFNEMVRVDSNLDGEGDSTPITSSFALFATGVGGAYNGGPALTDAASYSFRVTIDHLDAGDEDIALDNFLLIGDLVSVPEPCSFGFMLVGLGAIASRRRRS